MLYEVNGLLDTFNRRLLVWLQYMFIGVLFVIGFLRDGNATILHVAQDGDGSDGLTWATAYQSISSAIVQAVSGDQIWVKKGTYNEVLAFKTSMSLYGGFSGTEADDEFNSRNHTERLTIIDPTTNEKPAVYVKDIEMAIIDGFIITGGNDKKGGGIAVYNSSCEIWNCIVEKSVLGGIYCYKSSARVESCLVRNNSGGYGGICIDGNNGEEISNINGCIVSGNSCNYEYGGISCVGAHCNISNCLIFNNVVNGPESYLTWGGGIYIMNLKDNVNEAIVTLTNCTIDHNETFLGANYDRVSILAGNYWYTNPLPHIRVSNCIISDPTKGYYNQPVKLNYLYTNYIPHLVSGQGNISANPQFVSTSSSDEFPYQLKVSSPCIDAATGTELTNDILGATRPVDVPGVGHEGIFSADMGCYEFQLPAPTPTLTPTPMPTPTMNPKADINEDGRVDSKDLLIIESVWGRVVENK